MGKNIEENRKIFANLDYIRNDFHFTMQIRNQKQYTVYAAHY